jgi:hypothetical protein
MLFYWLDDKVINLLDMTGTRDKSNNLAERDSSPIITVLDRRYKGIIMCGIRTERDLD